MFLTYNPMKPAIIEMIKKFDNKPENDFTFSPYQGKKAFLPDRHYEILCF